MKILITTFTAFVILLSGTTASAACEFREESLDPDTGEKSAKTTWQRMTRKNPAQPLGSVSGMAAGEQVFLGFKAQTVDYFYPPAYSADDPERRAKLSEWESGIRQDALLVEAGSTLRISFADFTSLKLMSVADVASQGISTAPGAAVHVAGAGKNATSNYRVDTVAELVYALDPDDLEILTSKVATRMRIESRDRYYSMNPTEKNAHQILQDALKCVQ
jgi:hypothetical protein